MSNNLILAKDKEELVDVHRSLRLSWALHCAKQKNILGWGKALFPEKFYLPFCPKLHNYFIDIRLEQFTNTEAPRNHAKTLIKCFLIPLFQALNEPELYDHYLNVQATEKKALSINTAIRFELENNDLLQEIYGNQIGEKWTDSQFVLANGTVFTTIGGGTSIRGINYGSRRPSCILVDDLYDDEDINNPESTLKKNAWFWSSLYPARAKGRKHSIHVQGTAINAEDLLESLKKDVRWKSNTFRAVEDWDTKKVLWPELNTFDSLQADRESMGSVIFFRELQNERRDDATSIVKNKWLEAWEYEPSDLYKRLGTELVVSAVIIGNDPSIGEKVENDYTGTVLVVKTQTLDGKGNDFWIEGLWNEHISLDARVRQLETIAAEQPASRPVTSINIEAVAGFGDYSAEVIRRTNLPVHEIGKNEGRVRDKISNLENKSHFFENGKVHLSSRIAPHLKDMLKYQLTTNHPKHDDLRDGLLLCLDDMSGLWGFV